MKILYYVIFIYLLSSLSIKAGDWDIIKPDAKAYYVSEDSSIHVISIIRTNTIDEGVEYYNFYSNEITKGPVNNPNCVIENGAGWLGRKTTLGSDKVQFFHNEENHPMFIEPEALTGDSWKFFNLEFGNYVKATVKNVTERLVFGRQEAVKIIELQVYNNQDEKIDSDINGRELVLTKNYGFLKMFNMFYFPDSLRTYLLSGFDDGELLGIKPITYKDVFDFDIGDEFHIFEGDTNYNNEGVMRWRRIIVLDKTFFPDVNTFDYEVAQQVMQIRHSQGEFDTVYNDNFVHIRINLDDYTDYIPEQSYILVENGDSNLTSNRIYVGGYDGRQVIRPWVRYARFKYPCYIGSNTTNVRKNIYIEGCGEFFEEKYYFMESWRRLIYFKKGNQEWGEKLDFIVGVDNVAANEISIINEIVGSENNLQINIPESDFYHIKILDFTGRVVSEYDRHWQKGVQSLDCNSISNGMYFVRIGYNNKTFIGKMIIID